MSTQELATHFIWGFKCTITAEVLLLSTMSWTWDVKVPHKQITQQFGIEALYKWRAGPREEVICPRSRAWIKGPAGNSTHECWLLKLELIITGLTPSHVHQNKKPRAEDSSRAGQSPVLRSPESPRRQFAAQIGSSACRSELATDCQCWNQENQSLMKVYSVLCIFGAARLSALSPGCVHQILAEGQSSRRAWWLT